MIELIPLCTAELRVRERLDAGNGPNGHAVIAEIEAARLSGRLQGSHEGTSSADWLEVTPGGLRLPDIRLAIRTDDGALVLIRYTGRLSRTPDRPATPLVAATFQTGDPRYQWLTEIQAVGKGQMSADGRTMSYEFYEIR